MYEAEQATAACGIAWDGSQPTCVVAQGQSGAFVYNVGTSWVHNKDHAWVLATVFTPGNSENIANGNVTPGTHQIPAANPPQYVAGVARTQHTGTVTAAQGKFQLSAFDATDFQCSGTFDTIIKAYGGSCN